MSDAIASTSAPAVLSAPGSSGPVAVTVVSGADAAALLPDGAQLEGQARASKGVLEVITPNGVLQVKAAPGMALPVLPQGATLTLLMSGQGQGGQLFLVGINGRPLGGPAALNNLLNSVTFGGSTAQPATAGAQTAAPSGTIGTFTPSALETAGLTATVIRSAQAGTPAAMGTAAPPLPADLPPGTRLTVRIAGVEPPAGQNPAGATANATPSPAPSAPLPATPGGSAPLPQPGQPVTAPPAPAPVPPGVTAPAPAMPGGAPLSQVQGQAQPAPPSQTPAQPSPPIVGSTPQPQPAPGGMSAAPAVLDGVVTAHPPGGQAVVQTPIATLSVPTHADLPVGTRLTLEVVGNPQPPQAVAPAAPRPEGLTPQGWPALTEALDTLTTTGQPQALEQLLRVIPQPDARLAAAMVAFTGAIRQGSARKLLPETAVRGLEKAGKKEVAERIEADLEALSEETGRPVGDGTWHAYTMPMMHGSVVEPIRLFVRKPGGGDGRSGGSGDRPNDHRFVLDFNMSRMGRLQLDGLVRREDKLFDLIIRSAAPIDADMRRDILGIFTNASELVGTKGTVSFQSGGRWIEFPPAPPSPTRIEA